MAGAIFRLYIERKRATPFRIMGFQSAFYPEPPLRIDFDYRFFYNEAFYSKWLSEEFD